MTAIAARRGFRDPRVFLPMLVAMGHARGGHRRGSGAGPDFDPRAFGGGWRGMGFGPHGRGRRMRGGDVRAAALLLLDEQPRNGYQLMQEIEERSGGLWRPSPGSVYPALSQLEDEGLVRAEEEGSGRRFGLSDEGRAYVEEHRSELGEPWANLVGEGGSNRDLRRAI